MSEGFPDSRMKPQDEIQRRPRPVLSCLDCRKKKLKCDRLLPCQQCRKTGRAASCTYSSTGSKPLQHHDEASVESSRSSKRPRISSPFSSQRSSVHGSGMEPTQVAPPMKPQTIEELQNRVARLESSLRAAVPPRTRDSNRQDLNPLDEAVNGGTPEDGQQFRELDGSTASRYHARNQRKNLVILFEDARNFMRQLEANCDDPSITKLSRDLRALQRAIEGPPGPDERSVLNPSNVELQMVGLLPPREVCDRLVELYFDNYESCFRIFHRPSFLAEHDRFWQSGKVGIEFVPSLLGILSVASTVNVIPECSQVSLNGETFQPTSSELIESWLENLSAKESRTVAVLRIRVLMLLPQRSRSTSIDTVWNKSGQVVRYAMVIGLHRDPSAFSDLSVFECEQRRRLWMTVVEMDLTMSLMCGMPTMISFKDFTTLPPANLNDSELVEGMEKLPASQPTSEWTDTLCQRFLAINLPLRLEAYAYMSNIKANIHYEEVLKFSRSLEKMLQDLPAPLKFNYAAEKAKCEPGRLFARMTLDTFIRRLLLNLYTPFALATPRADIFREARLAYLQSCLVIQSYQDLFDPKFSEIDVPCPEGYWDLFYAIYRPDMLQTTLGICLEIKRLTNPMSDQDPLATHLRGSVPTRESLQEASSIAQTTQWTKATLIKVVDETIEPMVRRVSRPRCNATDLVTIVIVFHSVRSNGTPDRKRALITEGLGELISDCWRQLRKVGHVTSNSSGANGSAAAADSFQQNPLLDIDFFKIFPTFDVNMPTFTDGNFQTEPAFNGSGQFPEQGWY